MASTHPNTATLTAGPIVPKERGEYSGPLYRARLEEGLESTPCLMDLCVVGGGWKGVGGEGGRGSKGSGREKMKEKGSLVVVGRWDYTVSFGMGEGKGGQGMFLHRYSATVKGLSAHSLLLHWGN